MDKQTSLRFTVRHADGRVVHLCETRHQMIASTNRFLSRALRNGASPRIPRRRVDRGGFAAILRRRGARALVNHWWAQVLDSIYLD
jgi:hypothetical protein